MDQLRTTVLTDHRTETQARDNLKTLFGQVSICLWSVIHVSVWCPLLILVELFGHHHSQFNVSFSHYFYGVRLLIITLQLSITSLPTREACFFTYLWKSSFFFFHIFWCITTMFVSSAHSFLYRKHYLNDKGVITVAAMVKVKSLNAFNFSHVFAEDTDVNVNMDYKWQTNGCPALPCPRVSIRRMVVPTQGTREISTHQPTAWRGQGSVLTSVP